MSSSSSAEGGERIDLGRKVDQIRAMARLSGSELEQIGLEAAKGVVGAGAVEEVEVVAGLDTSDEPAYFFSFLVDQGEHRQSSGLLWTRLGQKIRDALIEQGDDSYPYVRVLSRQDWESRGRAPSA